MSDISGQELLPSRSAGLAWRSLVFFLKLVLRVESHKLYSIGQRVGKMWLPVDLESHYQLTVIY